MPKNKWQSSSGPSKNRILGATRLKGDGGSIYPVDSVNGQIYNGYALNVKGSNLVFGLGTSTPFSKLSLGNNTNSGKFNINDPGQLASIALDETSSGSKFSGMFRNNQFVK